MRLSLRTRLTAWYSVLLVLTVVVFSAAVLWLHWQLLLRQVDEGLASISATATNVTGEELRELGDLPRAVAEMAEVVRPADDTIAVLDAGGTPILPLAHGMPLPSDILSPDFVRTSRTLADAGGGQWRVVVRRDRAEGRVYFVAVGTRLDEAVGEWRALLKACAIGIPIAVLFAAAGGLWLGRHGLQPLTSMAAQAQAITARTPEARLSVPSGTSELEQLASSFNIVLDRLVSALATQRRFMADASHELRTPVSILRTAADVTLGRPQRAEAEYRDALSAISQQSSRLTRLVEDMLVLARADGGGYPVRREKVDMRALVEDGLREMAPRAAEREVELRAALVPATLIGDDALLRRLFANLLANAIAYSPRGGRVEVSLRVTEKDVVLTVADSGPGIPPQDRERVFERFVRLDPARGAGGAGLGLAIARWIAEVHHGRVAIVPGGGTGSTFEAQLSRASAAA